MAKDQSSAKDAIEFLLFIALFSIFSILSITLIFLMYPNLNGIGSIFIAAICATPIAFILFFYLVFARKGKSYQRFLVPALIFPIFSSLVIGWSLYQQRPTNIFKVFVADPIPVGVSNIQAQDVSMGIDQTIILKFNATPKAIDEIIAFNDLALSEYVEPYSELKLFKDIPKVDEQWSTYDFDNGKYAITMWVNPDRNIVMFLWLDF